MPASTPTIPTVQFKGRTLEKGLKKDWQFSITDEDYVYNVFYIKSFTDPECDTRPKDGLKPTTPHRAAGILTEPTQLQKMDTESWLLSAKVAISTHSMQLIFYL